MKIILTTLLVISCISGYAQTQPLKLDDQLATAKTKTGNQLLVTNGTTKLYASIKAGKVTNYFAMGINGSSIPVTIKQSKTLCQICIAVVRDGVASGTCYEIPCKDMVRPVTTKQQ